MIGIFGGTFDPIHLGHIRAVSLLHGQVEFERIHWVLSAQPPHKHELITDADDRFAMLELALEEFDDFIADESEIRRDDKSYTFYTAQEFREQNPDASICLIVGNDAVSSLHAWHRYSELIELVNVIVMNRPGHRIELASSLKSRKIDSIAELSKYKAGKLAVFDDTSFAVSSTQVRALFNQPLTMNKPLIEQTLNALLPPAVLAYIRQNNLYQRDKR